MNNQRQTKPRQIQQNPVRMKAEGVATNEPLTAVQDDLKRQRGR